MNPTDNAANLSPDYISELASMPERHRKRFYEGRYLTEVPGTLWPIDLIDKHRVEKAPQLTRIIVAVDPSGSDGVGGDRQGIVVIGKGIDGRAYVLEDGSCRLSPAGWGKQVVRLFHKWQADLIIAETNYGGAMVTHTIKTADPKVPVKVITASRGKHVRAEPISSMYENGQVSHVGRFTELEEQMGMCTTNGYTGGDSPDRMDALVWGATEVLLGGSTYGMLRVVS